MAEMTSHWCCPCFRRRTVHIGRWVRPRSLVLFRNRLCHDPRVDRFKEFYKNSFIADESFFQTVLMNHFDHTEVVNDDLRMIDWIPDGDIKLRPRNFGIADMRMLEQSSDLFARKFDSKEDPLIIGLLEAHLTCDAADIYTAARPPSGAAEPAIEFAA